MIRLPDLPQHTQILVLSHDTKMFPAISRRRVFNAFYLKDFVLDGAWAFDVGEDDVFAGRVGHFVGLGRDGGGGLVGGGEMCDLERVLV
jgi:hypothetical protein